MSAYLTIEKGTAYTAAIRTLVLLHDPEARFGTWENPSLRVQTTPHELRYRIGSNSWFEDAKDLALAAGCVLGVDVGGWSLRNLPGAASWGTPSPSDSERALRKAAAQRDAALGEAEKLRTQVDELREALAQAMYAMHRADCRLRFGHERDVVSAVLREAGDRADVVMGATKPGES